MADAVLDASAVLAVLQGEPGADEVWRHLPGACLSAVNAAEVASKLVDGGSDPEETGQTLERLGVRMVPFDAPDVIQSARLRTVGGSAGLSLGDRACLALAWRLGLPALTADRIWAALDTGVKVTLIR